MLILAIRPIDSFTITVTHRTAAQRRSITLSSRSTPSSTSIIMLEGCRRIHKRSSSVTSCKAAGDESGGGEEGEPTNSNGGGDGDNGMDDFGQVSGCSHA